jgi:predicted transcriptional regulator
MPKTSFLSVRLPEELAERLENLAKSTDRSKSYLAACAVEEYLAVQEWQVKAIREGMAAAEKGEIAGHEEALKELKRWDRR